MPDPPLTPLECPWVSKVALRNPSSASGTRSRLGGEFEQSCPRNKKIIIIRNMNSSLNTSTSKMDCGWTARPLRSLTVFPEYRRFESPLALMDARCVRDANSITPLFFLCLSFAHISAADIYLSTYSSGLCPCIFCSESFFPPFFLHFVRGPVRIYLLHTFFSLGKGFFILPFSVMGSA